MERAFDTRLESLRSHLLRMGGSVESALELALQGLLNRNNIPLVEVHKIEEKINQDHVQVDNECLEFLAVQGPLAKDLRKIVSYIKINADLERMGDQCVNIAHTTKDYLGRKAVQVPEEIEEMSILVRKMVKDSLDAFVREDINLSKKILLLDDEVDQRKQRVFRKLVDYIHQNPEQTEAALDLILIARNLERLGDHATNIAEVVIFFSTGEDIRHGGKFA